MSKASDLYVSGAAAAMRTRDGSHKTDPGRSGGPRNDNEAAQQRATDQMTRDVVAAVDRGAPQAEIDAIVDQGVANATAVYESGVGTDTFNSSTAGKSKP